MDFATINLRFFGSEIYSLASRVSVIVRGKRSFIGFLLRHLQVQINLRGETTSKTYRQSCEKSKDVIAGRKFKTTPT